MVSEEYMESNGESAYKNMVFVNYVFVLARNYKVFLQAIIQVTLVEVYFNEELHWLRGGHGFFSSSVSSF